MRVLVVRRIFDKRGAPVMDDLGRHREMKDAYLYQGRMYAPGSVIDMDDATAARELAVNAASPDGTRHAALMDASDAEAMERDLGREAKYQAEQFDDSAFRRRQEELAAQLEHGQEMRRRRDEQETRLSGAESLERRLHEQERQMEAFMERVEQKAKETEDRQREAYLADLRKLQDEKALAEARATEAERRLAEFKPDVKPEGEAEQPADADPAKKPKKPKDT